MTTSQKYLIRGLAVGGVLMAVGLAGLPSGESSSELSPNGESVNSVGFQELKKTLLEIRRTWNPNNQHRILDRAEHWAEVFEAPLQWLLARPEHDLIVEATYLAGELQLESTREQITHLARLGPKGCRPVAIVAAERIEPWSTFELDEFLMDDVEDIRAAALNVLALREDRPVDQILAALHSDSEKVRQAALAALPRELSGENLQVLLTMIESAFGEEALRLLGAIESIELSGEVEAFLNTLLLEGEPEIQQRAVDLLAGKGSRLSDPDVVWGVAVDIAQPRDLRAKAFLCLERTGSYDGQKLAEHGELNDPVLAYFAARCLLHAGNRKGAGMLLELLSDGASGLPDGAERAELLGAAGRLLGQLSGTSSGAGVEVWSKWYWDDGPVSSRPLPPPPFGW